MMNAIMTPITASSVNGNDNQQQLPKQINQQPVPFPNLECYLKSLPTTPLLPATHSALPSSSATVMALTASTSQPSECLLLPGVTGNSLTKTTSNGVNGFAGRGHSENIPPLMSLLPPLSSSRPTPHTEIVTITAEGTESVRAKTSNNAATMANSKQHGVKVAATPTAT